MESEKRNKTLQLTRLGILSAIIIIMAFTPLGYLKIGPLSITFLTVPVILGAMLLGPLNGAILGAVFGLTSFAQCFGLDPFGTTLLSINPIYTFLMCIVPRVLSGIVAGYLMILFDKKTSGKIYGYAITALAGVLTNTVFFVSFLLLMFGNTDYIRSFGENTIAILGILVSTNAIVEIIVCTLVITALIKPIRVAVRKFNRQG
jgi:uncharacterized membrane protein